MIENLIHPKPPSIASALKNLEDAAYGLYKAAQQAQHLVSVQAGEGYQSAAFEELARRLDAQADATAWLAAAMEAA